MDKTNVNIPLGMALLLNEIINRLLYEEVEVDGKRELKNRSGIPFRLLYRLNRNSASLARDAQRFEEIKQQYMLKYGTLSEDLSQITFTEENRNLYSTAINNLLDSPINHNIVLLDPDDLDKLTFNVVINPESMRLFIAYMTDDEEYLADLANPFTFNAPEAVSISSNVNGNRVESSSSTSSEPSNETAVDEVATTVTEEAPVTNTDKVEAPVEEVKPKRTRTTKKVSEDAEVKPKRTTKATSTTKKASATEKKSSTTSTTKKTSSTRTKKTPETSKTN